MLRSPRSRCAVVAIGLITLAATGCGSRSLPPSERSGEALQPTTTRIVVPPEDDAALAFDDAQPAVDDSLPADEDIFQTIPLPDVGDAAPSTDAATPGADGVDAVPGTAAATSGTGGGNEQPEATTAQRPGADGQWEDVTSNLVGLPSTCGNLSFVSAHPDDGRVIAGVAAQGLWQLDKATTTWNALGTGPGSAEINNRTSSITYDPLDPQRFWESGTYAPGVFRTDDGGTTFMRLGAIEDIDYVSIDMTDVFRRTMLAGGHEERALYRSINGGAEWFDITATLPENIGFTAYPVVIDAQTHLLGTYRGDEPGIFRTVDGGFTWERVHQGAVIGIPLIVDETIYWLRDGGAGILVSGVVFSPNPAAFYLWSFSCDFSGAGNPVAERSIMRLDATQLG
jgi:photosystem II stability/assembly factor-like uncharacterized protein